MKVWSKGLGKTELRADCRYYLVKSGADDGTVYLIGKITDPVDWEFCVTMEPEDVAGLLKLGLTYPMLRLFMKNLYRYFVYLVSRRKYAEAIDTNLEENVDAAYARLMDGRSGRRRLSPQRAGVSTLNAHS